ncbi:hypothetical protein A8W25_24775 [Streptomyces sp. ERV7]|uniref:SRPBCC family protein n=1 Tax=Streptomyces sp. ERV7 TaxID=1322334 RepID=UPI0007F3A420|nr:SRPBCC family protein [Streptomyces sp. ERV7]OAR22791.1 hypothetical protein A8W25_24775 [Streptomyces sp. ERV7]
MTALPDTLNQRPRSAALRNTRRLRAALLTVPLAVAGVLGAAAPGRATAPSPPLASLTCQGKGVDPAAKIRYRTATVVHAPLRTIWNLQTDVERWPLWQPPVTSVKRLDAGPLRQRSAFRWTTPVQASSDVTRSCGRPYITTVAPASRTAEVWSHVLAVFGRLPRSTVEDMR